MSCAIELTGVSKSYGGVRALDGVDMAVRRGELFGLIGPDGAGKSSIYRILATLLRPDAGRASVAGLDTVTDYRSIRTRIGYMPERFSLYQDLTVMENLRFFASMFGIDVSSAYSLIAPIFGQLERYPDRKAGALSGGMKQKLALSCALIHRPDILLLDEPTTGVDAVSRSEFWQILASLRDKGMTILVSTSYMDEATLCDRIAMIEGGRILATDTPAALAASFSPGLYNAVASDMFGLLTALRSMPGMADCYTFGATLHLLAGDGFSPQATCAALERAGIAGVRIYPAQPGIEDLFIRYIRRTHHERQ